jgi:hypothetical protein
MDDITQKYEFQQILRDAAEYRLLRRYIEAARGAEVASVQERLGIKDHRNGANNK